MWIKVVSRVDRVLAAIIVCQSYVGEIICQNKLNCVLSWKCIFVYLHSKLNWTDEHVFGLRLLMNASLVWGYVLYQSNPWESCDLIKIDKLYVASVFLITCCKIKSGRTLLNMLQQHAAGDKGHSPLFDFRWVRLTLPNKWKVAFPNLKFALY